MQFPLPEDFQVTPAAAREPSAPGPHFGRSSTVEAGQRAEQHHLAGKQCEEQRNWHEALSQYTRALENAPDHLASYLGLGRVLRRLGRLDEARRAHETALQFAPHSAAVLNGLGNVHRAAGQYELAVQCYEQAIASQPQLAQLHGNLGAAKLALGRHHEAVQHLFQSLSLDPRQPEMQYNLGVALFRLERLPDAAAALHCAVRLNPRLAAAWLCLGNVYSALDQLDQALEAFHHALDVRPDYAEAHFNRANTWRRLGRIDEAIDGYRRVLELDARMAPAHVNLGLVFKQLGRLSEAAWHYEQALHLQPDVAEAYNNLGGIWMALGQPQQAIVCYQEACRCQPDCVEAYVNLGNAWKELGHLKRAQRSFELAVNLDPAQPLRRLRLTNLCPLVFDSHEHCREYRQMFLAECERLGTTPPELNTAALLSLGCEPPFGLQFLDGNLRPLKEAYARIFSRLPQISAERRTGRPRVGLLVTSRHEAIFLRSLAGYLQQMRPQEFDLAVICSRTGVSQIRTHLPDGRLQIVELPESFERAIAKLASEQFDVIIYWEIGTDATNYFLPFFRLAPVQGTTIGTQVTSGIPQIDYYLSSRLLETAEAQEHYSEQLLLSNSLLHFQQAFDQLPPRASRDEFQLPEAAHVYLCAQNLGKFHPDFDELIAGILRNDPEGLFVLTEDRYGYAARVLEARFERQIGDVRSRIHFLPRLDDAAYRRLISVSDVLLDPPHFGGVNSSLDALLAGKPIVTLPSSFQRTRFTRACYERMQLDACIAREPGEYVHIATRLGTDAEYRRHISEEIESRSEAVLGDAAAVAEFERILLELVERARQRSW